MLGDAVGLTYPALGLEAYSAISSKRFCRSFLVGGCKAPAMLWTIQVRTRHELVLERRSENGDDSRGE